VGFEKSHSPSATRMRRSYKLVPPCGPRMRILDRAKRWSSAALSLARRQFCCWCVLAGMGDSGPVNESLEAESKPLAERYRVVHLCNYHSTTGNHAHDERLDGARPVVRICRVQAIAF